MADGGIVLNAKQLQRGLKAGEHPNLFALSVETLCVSTYSRRERLNYLTQRTIPRSPLFSTFTTFIPTPFSFYP